MIFVFLLFRKTKQLNGNNKEASTHLRRIMHELKPGRGPIVCRGNSLDARNPKCSSEMSNSAMPVDVCLAV